MKNILFELSADRLMRVDRRKLRKALLEELALVWRDGFQKGDETRRQAILESLGVVEG